MSTPTPTPINNNNNDDETLRERTNNYTWIYTPIIIFAIITLLFLTFRLRHQRRRIAAGGGGFWGNHPMTTTNPRIIYFSRHDLESQRNTSPQTGRRPNNNPRGSSTTTATPATNTSRWPWNNNRNPPVSRQDEGLNEFGEAPPPYELKNEGPALTPAAAAAAAADPVNSSRSGSPAPPTPSVQPSSAANTTAAAATPAGSNPSPPATSPPPGYPGDGNQDNGTAPAITVTAPEAAVMPDRSRAQS